MNTSDVAPVLEVRDLSVRFRGVVALDEVDVTVRPGEVVGIIGPNGAGKTTLIDVISGVRAPSGGSVHLDGNDVTARSATWRARRGLRRTFQRQQLFGTMSVDENVRSGLEWRSASSGVAAGLLHLFSNRSDEAAVKATLERCNLAALADHQAGSLPIGQARMVEFARAIVDQPRLLLLDEPNSGLGATETEALAKAIADLRDQGTCGVVLIEHDMQFVMSVCDRIVVLERGRRIAMGTPNEIRNDPAVRTAYLG